MHGTIPPLPQYVFMAWYLVSHRDNSTFTFQSNIKKECTECHNVEVSAFVSYCRGPQFESQLRGFTILALSPQSLQTDKKIAVTVKEAMSSLTYCL